MKGNCKHVVRAIPAYETGKSIVFVVNEYDQIFETADELDAFIRELIDARAKAFDVRSAWHYEP